jgi:hypothetical protein
VLADERTRPSLDLLARVDLCRPNFAAVARDKMDDRIDSLRFAVKGG